MTGARNVMERRSSAAPSGPSRPADSSRTASIEGTRALVAALKLAVGFALAAALLLFVEALLAFYPDALRIAALLAPVVVAGALLFTFARRRGVSPLPVRREEPFVARPAQPVLEPAEPETAPRPLSPEELIAEAARLFNESTFPRTMAGIAKTLGSPNASIDLFAGAEPGAVITIAWELSWYQYRVTFDATPAVELHERGQELDELAEASRSWNARVEDDGRLVPELEQE